MAKQEAQPEAPPVEKKKLPLKTIIVFMSVMLLEGAVIAAVFFLAGKPSDVKADGLAEVMAKQAERPVESKVVVDQFQNNKTGRTYLYETEVFVVIKQKHKDAVEKKIEEMQNQIKDEIALIFRRAEHAHLTEPTLTTLKRQIHAKLDEMIGLDTEGQSMIEKVLVPKATPHRADL